MGHAALIRDVDLAEQLGYARPRDLRKLVERLIRIGKLSDVQRCATAGRGAARVTVVEYHLTEGQALKVVAHSGVEQADSLLASGAGDGGEAIADVELARRLGYSRPRKIRDLIERLERGGKLNDVHRCATAGRMLSPVQQLKVVAYSRARHASAVLDEFAWRFPLIEGERYHRPRTRGDCADGIRPCPWVSCRHHLYLEVRRTGFIALNFPDLEPGDMKETCSLDVADRGPHTALATGAALGLSKPSAIAIEAQACERARRLPVLREFS
jgi:hypothetical protein